jgi:hypothetical protein
MGFVGLDDRTDRSLRGHKLGEDIEVIIGILRAEDIIELSKQRAEVVAELLKQSLKIQPVGIVGCGVRETGNETKQGREANRVGEIWQLD